MHIDETVTTASRDARVDLGGATLTRIVDIESMPFSAFDIFPQARPEDVRVTGERLGPRFVDTSTMELQLSFYSTLVRVGGRNVLIDTCCGNHKERPARPGWHHRDGPYLENLAAAGLRPEDIDAVMCTHLHADHVGWNTRLDNGRWVPTFPNAEYVFAEAEYAYWLRRHEDAPADQPILYGSFGDSVLPVVDTGQARMVEDGASPLAGVHLELVPGHTPGMAVIHVDGTSRNAVVCGDIIHHPLQLDHPHLSTAFCVDPDLGRRNRLALMERLAGTSTVVVPGHFPAPVFGCLERDGKGYRLAPV